VPLRPEENALDRKPIEWLREDYIAAQGRFSPDTRFLAYLSDQADGEKMQVYVRAFDAMSPETPPPGSPVQVSMNGALGMIFWRLDGRELYFLNRDWEVMAVEIETSPVFKAGSPKVLFKLPGPLVGNPMQWKNVTADGQRFIFAMPEGASTR
jgi:WD40-like Beta Propeller Repeat